MARQDSAYFEETKARMQKAGWGPYAIRLLFNNGIVDDFNNAKITLVEAKMHFPAIERHPLFNRQLVQSPPTTGLGDELPRPYSDG